MRNLFPDKNGVLKRCHIYPMLKTQKRHLSFHTPGHKRAGWDITELGYSDNLASPTGCIAEAQADIARVLGADKSFILTDGSTCGVLSMLYAFADAGYTRLAVPDYAHKSVKNGCKLCKITPIEYSVERLACGIDAVLENVDGLLLVSPDYYGNIPDLQAIRKACTANGKILLIDGAHGGHLHYDKRLYAGSVADMWVDGVHKSLPAFTQGAVVSAKTNFWSEKLERALDIFRTTSPSYPIMASVEYAVKYPENKRLEALVRETAKTYPHAVVQEDWTKFCIRGGKHAFAIQKALEKQRIYAEFCDGDILLFYLSPATTVRAFQTLLKRLKTVLEQYPYIELEQAPAPCFFALEGETENIELIQSTGRICAKDCGLFPPCIPLIKAGEKITEDKVLRLQKANHVFGLTDGKITVLKTVAEE